MGTSWQKSLIKLLKCTIYNQVMFYFAVNCKPNSAFSAPNLTSVESYYPMVDVVSCTMLYNGLQYVLREHGGAWPLLLLRLSGLKSLLRARLSGILTVQSKLNKRYVRIRSESNEQHLNSELSFMEKTQTPTADMNPTMASLLSGTMQH